MNKATSIWTPYPDFPNDYLVSEAGNIKSIVSGKILKQCKWKNYRKKVWLSVNGIRHMRYVHRVVAETYILNPNNLPEVNHIDGNRYNNKTINLEWTTGEQNRLHAKVNGLHGNPSGKLSKNFKGTIIAKGIDLTIRLNGKAHIESEGFDYNAVLAVIAGRQKTHKGLTFKRLAM